MGCTSSSSSTLDAHSNKSEAAKAEDLLLLERLLASQQEMVPEQSRLTGTLAKAAYGASTLRSFRPREVICNMNSKSDGLWILEGTVVQDKGSTMGINDFVGMVEMCQDVKMSHTIKAGPAGCLVRVFRRIDYQRSCQQRNLIVQQPAFKVLAASQICVGLTEPEVLLMRENMTSRAFGPNERIFTAGTQGHEEIFVVEVGSVIMTNYSNPNQDFAIPGLGIKPNLNPLDGFGLVPEALARQTLSVSQVFGQDVLLDGPSSSSVAPTPPSSPNGKLISSPAPVNAIIPPALTSRQCTVTASQDGCTCLVMNKNALAELRSLQFQVYRNLFPNDLHFTQIITSRGKKWMRIGV